MTGNAITVGDIRADRLPASSGVLVRLDTDDEMPQFLDREEARALGARLLLWALDDAA